MMSAWLLSVLAVLSMLAANNGQMPIPTHWGTMECKKWPTFKLQDFQPQSGANYLQSYGLSDMLPAAQVTIVGLYFADDEECRETAARQADLTADLEAEDIVVHNVALNYYAPKSCALEECTPSWYYYPFFLPWYSDTCMGYIAGCKPDDSRLDVATWQALLANATTLPIFQDTEWDNIWDDFGGDLGDLFIYDASGRLYSYICAGSNDCGEEERAPAKITNDTGYAYVLEQAVLASTSNGTERCAAFNDDDEHGGWADDFYYYYYDDKSTDAATTNSTDEDTEAAAVDNNDDDDDNDDDKDDEKADDDKSDDKKKDDDKGDDDKEEEEEEEEETEEEQAPASDESAKGKDDDYDDDDDDVPERTANRKQKKKSSGTPSYVIASFVALFAFGISAFGFYMRWKWSQNEAPEAPGSGGATKFTRLPTTETPDVFSGPDNQLELELRGPSAKGGGGKVSSGNDGAYGSI